MIKLPKSFVDLVDSFKELPGVGVKTAERLSYFILESDSSFSEKFSKNLLALSCNINICNVCFFFVDGSSQCICKEDRDRTKICVVQQPKDVISFDRTGYTGLYHVIGGVLSPLDNIGPDELNIKELIYRLDDNIEEVILAMDSSLEGDATSIYMSRIIEDMHPKIRISRLARGIPMGGQFDYIDDMTLMRAFDERTEI